MNKSLTYELNERLALCTETGDQSSKEEALLQAFDNKHIALSLIEKYAPPMYPYYSAHSRFALSFRLGDVGIVGPNRIHNHKLYYQ